MELDQLFDKFDSQDSLAILFITIIGFLFGLLVGFLLRSPRIRQLQKELKEARDLQTQLRVEAESLREQLKKKDAEVQRVNADMVALTGRIDDLEFDKGKLAKEMYEARMQLDRAQETNRTYMSTIEDLNNQLVELKTEREQIVLADANDGAERSMADPADAPALYLDARDRLELIEEKLERLERENETMKMELDEMRYGAGMAAGSGETSRALDEDNPMMAITLDEEADDEIRQEDLELPWTRDRSIMEERIIVADREKDDLTLINGVGPFLEKKLNQIGVFTFEQVSEWDDDQLDQVTKQIGYFPGRIQKDDWIGQAAQLRRLKEEDPEALATRSSRPNNSQDLKVVEGIGPKIEQLLNRADIFSWQDLAETEVEQLVNILDTAGDDYRMHDPGTWPRQAGLAAQGKWEELEDLQAELRGGREEKTEEAV